MNIRKKLSVGYFEGQVGFCFVDKPGKTMKMDSKDPIRLSALKAIQANGIITQIIKRKDRAAKAEEK